jgi:hypothetical protein
MQVYVQRPNSWTKSRQSLKSFPPCYSQSPLQLALRFLFLQTHATSYSFYSSSMYTVREKGEKPEKPYPLPYGLRNSCRNLKSENSQDYAQKPQRNCPFLNSASVLYNISTCTLASSETRSSLSETVFKERHSVWDPML